MRGGSSSVLRRTPSPGLGAQAVGRSLAAVRRVCSQRLGSDDLRSAHLRKDARIMTLRVDPSAIRGYAKQLADLERAATTAIQYVSTYGDLNTHRTGILGEILPLHQDFVHAVKTMLARISTLADGCN